MTVFAHGVRTQYQRIGIGPNLVLLHGWGGDWQSWYSVIPALSDHFQVIIPDIPVFGTSENPPETWTSHDYAVWLQDFIHAVLPNEKFSLAGHSFGGKIASIFASRHPAMLQKLILVDAAGLPDELSVIKKAQHRLLRKVPDSLKEKIPFSLKKKLLAITNSASDHLHSNPAQRRILANIIREYIRSDLERITVPTLLLWGENDLDTPVSQAKKFATFIPHARLEILPGAGHFSFQDQTNLFISELEKFLS